MDETERTCASTMLNVTQQLRTHWSGIITSHFGFALMFISGIWSYLGKAYIDSFKDNDSKPVFLYLASAISAVYLGLWRLYTKYLDNHLASLYPDFLHYEQTLGVPPERGISGYLSREVPRVGDLLKDLSLNEKISAISKLISMKRIGRRGHLFIDIFSLIVIVIPLVVLFFITPNSESIKERWWWLIANMTGVVFIIIALAFFQNNPCKSQIEDVKKAIKEEKNQIKERIFKMNEENGKTYFFDTDKKLIADGTGILPIPLYKGMKISIYPYDNEYEVIDWNFHWGQPDEKSGLRIFLKETSTKAAYRNFKV